MNFSNQVRRSSKNVLARTTATGDSYTTPLNTGVKERMQFLWHRLRDCSRYIIPACTALRIFMSDHDSDLPIHNDRLWKDDGWTARVIKNDDDEGWAVAMYKDGESEPALVGPWTMGRDKKNPKPLDTNAFSTLVKTASEVLRRHEQQLHANLNKSVSITFNGDVIEVTLTIVPDEYEPHGVLKALDEQGNEIASKRVEPNFSLTRSSASAWADQGFSR